MSKAYPSNLSRDQYEFLSNLLPEAKPGGRPREVDLCSTLSKIQNPYTAVALADRIFFRLFSILVELGIAGKVWLSDCDPDTVENSPILKWLKSS